MNWVAIHISQAFFLIMMGISESIDNVLDAYACLLVVYSTCPFAFLSLIIFGVLVVAIYYTRYILHLTPQYNADIN